MSSRSGEQTKVFKVRNCKKLSQYTGKKVDLVFINDVTCMLPPPVRLLNAFAFLK